MKNQILTALTLLLMFPVIGLNAQKKALKSITQEDLKFHLEYLASDELEGRDTGELGLIMAADYLEGTARHLGLGEASPESGYLQEYIIEERAYDWENSFISVTSGETQDQFTEHPFFVFPAVQNNEWSISGEVVFAGYGIKEDNFDYNDYEGVDVEGKIVLIMNRAPMNEDGTTQFGDKWNRMQNFQYKMEHLVSLQPKAILLVMDPKSGFNSVGDMAPGVERYLSRSRGLKMDNVAPYEGEEMGPKMVMIHREVADRLMAPYGKDLITIQNEIDETLEPQSFVMDQEEFALQLTMKHNDLTVPNVFGVIEGSDPELKDEYVIYVAHYDHVGTDGEGGVFNGADDNGSGTVALIEIAEAFMKEKKRPKRSVGILWVSAEEIGLFGSRYFANNPMVPIEQIVTVINLDMVGRVVTQEDEAKGRQGMTIVGRDSVKVIGAKQSTVLMEINEQTLEEMDLLGNYQYNDPTHPARYYYRSDHINFARKDIPVLFYSTGTHADYHELTDVEERIDYNKFLRMTKFCYKAGFNVANYPGEITVDNPMSGW